MSFVLSFVTFVLKKSNHKGLKGLHEGTQRILKCFHTMI